MLQDRPGDVVLGAHPFARSFPPWIYTGSLAVAVGIAYFLAARLSLALLTPDGVAVFWPAAGVSAGVLIALGPKARLSVIIGVIAATIAANLLGDRNIPSAIVFAGCNAFEAVLVSDLIGRYFGIRSRLGNLRGILGLVTAAIIGAAVSGEHTRVRALTRRMPSARTEARGTARGSVHVARPAARARVRPRGRRQARRRA